MSIAIEDLNKALQNGDMATVTAFLDAGGSIEERMPYKINAWNDERR